jgi:hypothetical protein
LILCSVSALPFQLHESPIALLPSDTYVLSNWIEQKEDAAAHWQYINGSFFLCLPAGDG